jgi:hypothetical protein
MASTFSSGLEETVNDLRKAGSLLDLPWTTAEIIVTPKTAVRRKFRWAAVSAFPKETYALLLGREHKVSKNRYLVSVDYVFVPDDVDKHSTEEEVILQSHWDEEAAELAYEYDLQVVGDIHTHPRKYSDFLGYLKDASPSEGDFRWGWGGICGICVVAEQKDGRLRTRTKFYGPAARLR